MTIAKITLADDLGQVWRGSLRQFFRDNDYDLAGARQIIADLRGHNVAIIGGGAAALFSVSIARNAA